MSRSLKRALSGLSLLIVFVSIWGTPGRVPAQEAAADEAAAAVDSDVDAEDTANKRRNRSQQEYTWHLSAPTAPVERIEHVLDDPQGVDIDFSFGQPLKEALEFLQDAHGITIILDEKAVADIGIQPDEQLNHVLNGITFRSALNIMLEPLGLTYVVEDEVLKITTQEVADRALETRVYDVRALDDAGFDSHQLASAITETLRPDTWPNDAQSFPGPGGGFGPAGPRRSGEREPARRIDTGIMALNGALVVTHNQDMQRRIVALLDQLAVLADRHGED